MIPFNPLPHRLGRQGIRRRTVLLIGEFLIKPCNPTERLANSSLLKIYCMVLLLLATRVVASLLLLSGVDRRFSSLFPHPRGSYD